VPGTDPAQERNAGADHDDACLELGEHPHEQSRNGRSEREGSKHGPAGRVPRKSAPLCVGDDLVRKSPSPARRLLPRPRGEGLGRHHTVHGSGPQMVEDPPLVRVEPLFGRGSKSHVEDTGTALLHVDDVPRCEVDQGRGYGVAGDPEVVDEKVRDRRRLGPELESPRTDRWLGRTSNDENDRRRYEPRDRGRCSRDREHRIRPARIEETRHRSLRRMPGGRAAMPP
jgi:hypothetical protein